MSGRSGGTLRLHNIEIDAPNHTRSAIVIRNRGFTGEKWGIEARGVRYEAPSVFGSGVGYTVQINTVSGDAPAFIHTGGNSNSNTLVGHVGLGAADANVKVAGVRESGGVSGTTPTDSGFLDIPVTFARRFPKDPQVITDTHVHTTNGTDVVTTEARAISPTGFIFRFYRADAAENFAAALAMSGSWSASLDEY